MPARAWCGIRGRGVMVVTAAAKDASVGKESFAIERDAVWRGIVGKFGSW